MPFEYAKPGIIAIVNEDASGPAERPDDVRMSPDLRSWWTGREWVPPLYERAGLSAFVTFMSRFLGTLRVFPGAVVFAQSERGLPSMANTILNVERLPAVILHSDPKVAIVHGRFAAPWLNSGVVLVDRVALNTSTAVVQLPGWERRRLVDALGRAGFAIDRYRAAFSLGSNIGSVAELERLRRRGGEGPVPPRAV